MPQFVLSGRQVGEHHAAIDLAIIRIAEWAELGRTHERVTGVLQEERRLVAIGRDHRQATRAQIHDDIHHGLFAGAYFYRLRWGSSVLAARRLRLHQLIGARRDIRKRNHAISRATIALRRHARTVLHYGIAGIQQWIAIGIGCIHRDRAWLRQANQLEIEPGGLAGHDRGRLGDRFLIATRHGGHADLIGAWIQFVELDNAGGAIGIGAVVITNHG